MNKKILHYYCSRAKRIFIIKTSKHHAQTKNHRKTNEIHKESSNKNELMGIMMDEFGC